MTFVSKVPKRVEDLFELAPGDNNTAMEAVLENGTKLYLSDGPAMNFPSPWPLWYHMALAPEAVTKWLDEAFAQAKDFVTMMEPQHLEERSDLWQDRTSYFGPYMRIGGLEVGVTPVIGFRVRFPRSFGPDSQKTFDYNFASPIVAFNPLSALPDKYPDS